MKKFDFAGNKAVLERLGYLFDSGRFPHALIIEGEQGLGKRTLARQLASMLVCRGEEKPCFACTQCKKVMEQIHPDVFEHSANGGANSFHVDVVRKVIGDAYMQPNEAEYKIYILGNADCMNASAQNALLKILEEPPAYVVFILTVANKSRMLETVLSRSVVVTLEGVDTNEGTAYITGHFDGFEQNEISSSLSSFNGNIGKTLDAVRQGKNNQLAQVCSDICMALVKDNEYELITLCSAFQKDRQAIVFSMELLKNFFRDALVGADDSNMFSGRADTVKILKNKLTRQNLIDLINICDKLKEMALMNSNNQLLITKICYSLRTAIGR